MAAIYRRKAVWCPLRRREVEADVAVIELQVLEPVSDPGFSESSYGFSRSRSAHRAVLKVREYVADGRRWVADLELGRVSGLPCRVANPRAPLRSTPPHPPFG